MRAVLDPNVIISAVLSPSGSPAKVMRAWLDGAYELIVSPLLLEELERALGYPKLRARVGDVESQELLELLRRGGDVRDDPSGPPPVRSPDPADDYLLALAAATQAIIVSGDRHRLGLSEAAPAYAPAAFLTLIKGDRS